MFKYELCFEQLCLEDNFLVSEEAIVKFEEIYRREQNMDKRTVLKLKTLLSLKFVQENSVGSSYTKCLRNFLQTDSLVDSFNVTLLTGPGPSVMLLRSLGGLKRRQRRGVGKGKSFQFTAGRVGSTKSGGVADETLQNHHPSLLSLPVVSSRHKPAPGQTPPVPDQEQSPPSWHCILHLFPTWRGVGWGNR